MTQNCCSQVTDAVFDYNTPKIVHIKSKVVGFIYRFVQLVIIGYIIGYVLIYKKGYQVFDTAQSSVTSKVKGVAYVNFTEDPNIGARVWDPADYIIPSEENGAFFVMTNMIITRNQTNSVCPEDTSVRGANCHDSSDCKSGEHLYLGHGVNTGECVPTHPGSKDKTCEIYAWCPLEYDHLRTNYPFLYEAANFTLLIKNSIVFPKFNARRSNIDAVKGTEDLKHCMYDGVNDTLCPIFKLDTIVKAAGQDFNKIAYKGGVIGILIEWQCNLDFDIKNCLPKFTFRRLDDPHAPTAVGYNFRYPIYYEIDYDLHRDLVKAYGIRFVFIVIGQAGKFSVVPLLLNIGSGLALLAIASVISDIVVLYIIKKRAFYRSKKYQTVTPFDDNGPLLDDE